MNVPGPRIDVVNPWLAREPSPGARLRLVCFHHAGGAASTFSTWASTLEPDIAVLPVQLPARERRVHEPCPGDLATLVAALDEALDETLSEPYAMYGHSMGALIAYSLVRRRYEAGRTLPVRLLLGAYPAVHLAPPLEQVLGLDDDRMVRWLCTVGGMSPTVARYPDWTRAAVRLFRDDLRLCSTARHPADDIPLPLPIDVLTGADDPLMTSDKANAWARYTTVGCQVHVVPGGHLFVRDAAHALPALLSAILSADLAAVAIRSSLMERSAAAPGPLRGCRPSPLGGDGAIRV